MSTPIEIETTILSGLPVRVTANIQPAERDVGIMYPWPEDIQIFWTGKKPREIPQSVYDRISKRESDLLNEQIMEEYQSKAAPSPQTVKWLLGLDSHGGV